MKTTLYAAVAALALAFAPLANAQEGGRDPFPFSAGPIATTHFTNGVADYVAAAPRDMTGATRTDAAAAAAAAPAHGQAYGQPYGTVGQSGGAARR